jgi:hypothetical protein
LNLLGSQHGSVADSCEASNGQLNCMKGREFYVGECFVTVSYCERLEFSTCTIQKSDSILCSPNNRTIETFFFYCKAWGQGA